ncbi:hypothetical protein B0H14DRAFT_3518390 [Mycena olivaceomarginata]|nr:hypothetical protein B0H14DRAFT_3518390 [Mycena olivaceomarginata]
MPCVAPLSASRLCASVASGPPAKNRARKLHSPTPAAAYDTIYRPNTPFIALHLPAVPLPILPPTLPPSPYPTEHLHLPLLTRQPRNRTTAGRRPCPAHTVDARREFIMLDRRFWARDRGPGGLRPPFFPIPPPHLIYTHPARTHPFEDAMHPCLLLPSSLLADRAWGVRRLSSLREPPAGERGAS